MKDLDGKTLFDHQSVMLSLASAGYEAFYVGGAVRDRLLKRECHDWDITTVATPDQVREVFPDADFVGAHFGVSLVKTGTGTVEVATYRTDGSYGDSRRPDTVEFTTDVKLDLQRRDFTINALLMDADFNVIDHVGGVQDLDKRLIRAVGDAGERFREDALRMLRAVRFACQLGFNIEEMTRIEMATKSSRVQVLSAERVQQELSRILTSGKAGSGIRLLEMTGLLAEILPDIAKLKDAPQNPLWHPEGDVLTHTVCLLKQLTPGCSLTLALAALLHDVGKPTTMKWKNGMTNFHGHEDVGAVMAERILRDLKYSNDVIEVVVSHVAQHMRFWSIEEMKTAKLMRFIRQANFEELLQLHWLDATAGSAEYEHYRYARQAYEETPLEKMAPPRLVTGDDLIAMGETPGPEFKDWLEGIESLQLQGKITTREEALEWLKKMTMEGEFLLDE